MKFTFVNLTLVLFIALSILTACNSDVTNNNADPSAKKSNQTFAVGGQNADSVKDDVDELEKIVKLPVAPDEVNYWEESFVKNGAAQKSAQPGKKVIAVLRFTPENSALLLSRLEKIRLPSDNSIEAETRFPAELIAQSQLSGDESLKGKLYAADDFFQPPYTEGKITRVENSDYFVLELNTQ